MSDSQVVSGGRVIPFKSKSLAREQLLEEIEKLRLKIEDLEKVESGRKSIEAALNNRLALEKRVAAISTRFLQVPLGELDHEIERALREIGAFMEAEQCFLGLLDPDGKKVQTAYLWSAQGDGEKGKILNGLSLEPFEWAMEKLRTFQTVLVQTVNGFPFKTDAEEKIFEPVEVRSLLAIPLSIHSRLVGILGLSLAAQDKTWAEEDTALLKIMGEILINGVERKRIELALQGSERRFQIISKITTDGASSLRLEKDGTFVREWITESLSRIFGINPEEVNSYGSYVPFIHPEDLTIFYQALSKLMTSKEPITAELRALTKKGEVRWLRAAVHPEWDEQEGRVIRLINALQDITERKRAEEELKRSEERYRSLVKNAPLGILSTNREGQVIEMNPTLLNVLGFAGEEAANGINVFSHAALIKAGIAGDLQGCLETGKPAVHERLYKGNPCRETHLRYHLTPLRDASGEIMGLQAIFEDVTERKRLENQLLQAQKMEAIGTLAGGIAHDFNNILAGIIGYGELLDFEVSDRPKAKTCLAQLLKAADRAKELIKQILVFSRRNDQGKEIISVEPILQESLKLLRASLPSTIQIRAEIEGYPGAIRANPTQIQQIVVNLVTNAAQAMPEGGGTVTITLKKVRFDGEGAWKIPGLPPGAYVCLTVNDTGQGMAPEVIRRIFDPYFTTKERGKGTGLGLAVVHGIVKNHDGAITVESEVGRGTTFEIYLPLVQGLPITQGLLPVDQPAAQGRGRILYVDDEPLVAEVGRQMLEKLGYEVIPMLDGQKALEVFQAQPDHFDLVVTDMTMPNLTGDRMAQKMMTIRNNIPIVLCTGYSERITEKKAKEMGIREFVSKPFSMNDLAGAVVRALESSNRLNGLKIRLEGSKEKENSV